ncbi:hypothetical protein TPHV1_30125 [Treponema phagedenis]|uniref:Uncharacterized protein n=1 Tax=Treponema phagedenis TaxID=162 RepID=A0A0B7GZ39_TREPH|nr:hypothetical protein TPHV1_30125 [Treponema phagedenis]
MSSSPVATPNLKLLQASLAVLQFSIYSRKLVKLRSSADYTGSGREYGKKFS